MINFVKKLLNYIYKNNCYFCSKSIENTIFCSSCFEKVEYLPIKELDTIENCKIYSCCLYEGIIKKLIRGLKYHNQKDLAYYQAKIMKEYWINIEKRKESYTVIPVPLHNNRKKYRKYNHMELVANCFCELLDYKLDIKTAERIKETLPQYKLSKKQREENLKNAFKINKKISNNTPILIIDDITTTGSTLLELIKELKNSGYNNITGFTTAIPEKNSFYIN